eukprot:37593-Eustigmatos_ZCMA.PRE.1
MASRIQARQKALAEFLIHRAPIIETFPGIQGEVGKCSVGGENRKQPKKDKAELEEWAKEQPDRSQIQAIDVA